MRLLILILIYWDVFTVYYIRQYREDLGYITMSFPQNNYKSYYKSAYDKTHPDLSPNNDYFRAPEEAEKLGGHDLAYWQDIKNYTPEQRAMALEYVKGQMELLHSTLDERNQAMLELSDMRPEEGAWYSWIPGLEDTPGIKREDPKGGLFKNGHLNYTLKGPIKYIKDYPTLQLQQLRQGYHDLYKKNGIYNTLIRKARNGEDLTPEEEDKLIEGYVRTQLNSKTKDSTLDAWNAVKGTTDIALSNILNWFGGEGTYNINPKNFGMKSYRPTLNELLASADKNTRQSLNEQIGFQNPDPNVSLSDAMITQLRPGQRGTVAKVAKRAQYGDDVANPENPRNIVDPASMYKVFSNSPLTETDEEDFEYPGPGHFVEVHGWKGVTHPDMSEAEVREKYPHRPDYHGMPLGEPDNPNILYRGQQLLGSSLDNPNKGSTNLGTPEIYRAGDSWGAFFDESDKVKPKPISLPNKEEIAEAGLKPIDVDFLMRVAQGYAKNTEAPNSIHSRSNYGITQDLVTTARQILNAPDKNTQINLLKKFEDLMFGLNSNNNVENKVSDLDILAQKIRLENLDVGDFKVNNQIYKSHLLSNPFAPWLSKKDWAKHVVEPGSPEDLWNKAKPRYDDVQAQLLANDKESDAAFNEVKDKYLTMKDFPIWSKQSQALREKRKQEYLKKRELERQKNKQQ